MAPSRRNSRSSLPRDHGASDLWTRAIEATVLTKVALLVLVLDPAAADTFTLPKSTVGNALSLVLGALLVGLVAVGGVRALRWTAIHWVAVVLLIVFVLSSALGLDTYVSVFGAPRRYLGLLQLADATLLFVGAGACFRRPAGLARLIAVAFATSLVVIAYGTIQRLGHDPILYKETLAGRAFSTLGQPDLLAGYLSVIATTAAAVLIFCWKTLGWPGRVGLVALGATSIELLFSTLARLGLLGLIGGGGAIAVLIWLIYPHRRRVAVLSFCGGAATLAAITWLSPLGQRLNVLALLNESSVASRLEIWQTAARLVAGRPLLGIGPDNFIVAYPAARGFPVSLNDALQSSTHDWLLYYATSAGLIGATAVLLFVALVVIAAGRLARRGEPAAIALVPLAAYLGQGLANVNDVGLDWFMWIAAGIMASSLTTTGRDRPKPGGGRRPAQALSTSAQLALAAMVLVAAGLAVAVAQPRLGASEALAESERLVAIGRPLDAVQASRAAISLDSRRADYWSGFGTALSAAGSPSAALNAYEAAAEREPWWPLHRRNIALMKLSLGDEKGAFAALERATANDPYDASARNLLAKLAYNDGQYARAIDEGERAVQLLPLQSDVYDAPVQSELQTNQLARAERLVMTGLSRVNDLHLHVLLAKVYVAAGRIADARAEVAYVLLLEPTNAEALTLSKGLSP